MAIAFASPVIAGNPRDISSLLRTVLANHRVPGLAAVTIQGDQLVATGVAGLRVRGRPELITIHDQFHLGSDTKAMTATLCAMLVEQGKLAWTTTPADVFPSLREKMDPAYRTVTLQQLLTHRAGCPDTITDPEIWPRFYELNAQPLAARQLLTTWILTHPPAAPPGSKYIYSNFGFAIAGHMAEQVTGKPWETLLRESLFTPLGMSTAGYGPPGNPHTHDQPRGHTALGIAVPFGPAADNPTAIGPAGTVHCSLPDWARFIAFHLTNGRSHPGLLRPESFTKLHTPVPGTPPEPDYAMGWGVASRPWAGGTVLTHAGSNTLWYAVVWIAPKENFAVLAACNQGGDDASKACDDAASALIQDFLQSQR